MLPLVEFPQIVQHYAPWFEAVFSAEALVQFQRYLSGLIISENKGDTIRPQGDLHVVGLGARTLTAGLDCIPLAAWVEDVAAPKVSPAASKRALIGPAADVGFGQCR